MLKKQDRVVIANGGLQHALGIVRIARNGNLQARRVEKIGIHRLRVLGGSRPDDSVHGTQRDGQGCLSARHVTEFGGLIANLVHGDPEKSGDLDLNHRPVTGNRCSNARSHKAGFADRRVANALGAELFDQPSGGSESGETNILSHDKDPFVTSHFLANGFIDRLDKSYFSHGQLLGSSILLCS